ncbi:MAG TPA: pyridoxal-dependent decarboxylase [Anaerolineales bacterium]|nr:pyridoxal-dependent decarboxylase [Anaerolineales bacterium]
MYHQLSIDNAQTEQIIQQVVAEAKRFLANLSILPAGAAVPSQSVTMPLPEDGLGALNALSYFKEQYAPWLSGSVGARYYGLVTGGVTPAALAGDWLVSLYDQNNVGADESIAPLLELQTLALLRQLFHLPDSFSGSFVSGATMSNFVGLALARQWVGRQMGVNVAQDGLALLPSICILSGAPHSSIYKALSMLGLGRGSLKVVPCLPNREAVNLAALEEQLQQLDGQPCIVVANAGTVNTVDFDDLSAITELRTRYNFWMHVDAAFGGFASCSPQYAHWVQGIAFADSITIDAHKWLNVPYDSAMQFTRHPALQAEVFQNAAVYLEQTISSHNFVHLTPENSRRFRALPSWFTLMAYGKQGYAEIVERNCQLAQWLGEKINSSQYFQLLAPVRLNGICFTFRQREHLSLDGVKGYLKELQEDGAVYLTPTVYAGTPAIRVSISNWRTTQADVEIAWGAMQDRAVQTHHA